MTTDITSNAPGDGSVTVRERVKNSAYTAFFLNKDVKKRLYEFRESLNLPKNTWNNVFTRVLDFYIKYNNEGNGKVIKYTDKPPSTVTADQSVSDISFIEKPIKEHMPKIQVKTPVVKVEPPEPSFSRLDDLLTDRYKAGVKPGRRFSSY